MKSRIEHTYHIIASQSVIVFSPLSHGIIECTTSQNQEVQCDPTLYIPPLEVRLLSSPIELRAFRRNKSCTFYNFLTTKKRVNRGKIGTTAQLSFL